MRDLVKVLQFHRHGTLHIKCGRTLLAKPYSRWHVAIQSVVCHQDLKVDSFIVCVIVCPIVCFESIKLLWRWLVFFLWLNVETLKRAPLLTRFIRLVRCSIHGHWDCFFLWNKDKLLIGAQFWVTSLSTWGISLAFVCLFSFCVLQAWGPLCHWHQVSSWLWDANNCVSCWGKV